MLSYSTAIILHPNIGTQKKVVDRWLPWLCFLWSITTSLESLRYLIIWWQVGAICPDWVMLAEILQLDPPQWLNLAIYSKEVKPTGHKILYYGGLSGQGPRPKAILPLPDWIGHDKINILWVKTHRARFLCCHTVFFFSAVVNKTKAIGIHFTRKYYFTFNSL